MWILPDKEDDTKEKPDSPKEALIKSFKLFVTADMMQLVVFFIYLGLALSFWSGVYGTALGRTRAFPDPKSMPG
jgi:hypothetical protein